MTNPQSPTPELSQKPLTRPEPVETEIVETEPLKPAPMVTAGKTCKWWQVWKPREKQPKRALLLRLFGIGIWGTTKLIILCIIVGFVLLTMQFDPTSPSFDASEALGLFLTNAMATGKWAVTNFWKPALTGSPAEKCAS